MEEVRNKALERMTSKRKSTQSAVSGAKKAEEMVAKRLNS